MKKIFVSHNQDFSACRAVKALLMLFGVHPILVEDEPGAQAVDKKAYKLLKESESFLGVCTKDLKSDDGRFFPKQNVCLEIKEWQRLHEAHNMVILKERGVEIPALLGNPAYCEFDGTSILNAFHRAVQEFQSMGVIKLSEDDDHSEEAIDFTDKEIQLLITLAASDQRSASEVDLQRQLRFSTTEWNIAMHKLETKFLFITRIEDPYDGNPIMLLNQGFEYLLNNNLVK